MKYITILNFSGRKDGNCEQISNIIKHYYEQDANICANAISVNIEPCKDCNYECLRTNSKCAK